jgi:hypothetical protein
MKKIAFQILAKVNKLILPRYSKRDITRLSKLDKMKSQLGGLQLSMPKILNSFFLFTMKTQNTSVPS